MKILLLDIETAPNVADVWDLWNQNVSLNQLRESSYMMCWAAKWLGEDEMFFGAFWELRVAMYVDIYRLLNEADVAVTYNGDRFDLPTLNKEFLQFPLTPPAPYKSVDIYKTIKSRFKFPSGKLQYVAQALKVGSKAEHEGHDLWVKVRNGDEDAQRRMAEYCKQDVVLLEGVFEKVRPWIKGFPNMLLTTQGAPEDLCPRCGEGYGEKRGFLYTQTGKYQRYRCDDCGGWFKSTKRVDGVQVAPI